MAGATEAFSASFGSAPFGRLVGLLHDLGKAKPAFQRYLRGGPSEPHAAEGARFLRERLAPGARAEDPAQALSQALELCIAAHHAGLANAKRDGGGRTPLATRLEDAATLDLPDGLALPALATAPAPLSLWHEMAEGGRAFASQFFARMMLSCLVDADRLATEAFYARAAGGVDRDWHGSHDDLRAALDRHLAGFGKPRAPVARLRAEVTQEARGAATLSPGLFSLTVPTGGGKTLASLAFALDHMAAYDLDRVVYVAPFTAIIEQTADVFRTALGDADAVLEHHSGFDIDADRERSEDERLAIARATENWNRPVVVTTAVQLFESLFAADTRRCRKLHRLARSVIVLDEAQALPLPVLRPCLAAVNELARAYGASAVLCTATQPAVTRAAGAAFPEALRDVREIVSDPPALHARMRRVRVEVVGATEDADLAGMLAERGRGLAIVNSRAHARDLFAALDGTAGRRHLTTAMTGRHRRAALEAIKGDLHEGRPCVVVSTSLIEAGVDISFPLVLRALAGLDSIAQAAGRCNRSGELGPAGGRVVVFEPADAQTHRPPRELARFAEVARAVLAGHDDPLSDGAIQAYFRELYWQKGDEQLDAREVRVGETTFPGIMSAIHGTWGGAHSSVAEAFRLIDQAMLPVIVPEEATPHGAPRDLLARLYHAETIGGLSRRLQPFVVPVPQRARAALIAAGAVEVVREAEFGDAFAVLTNPSLYGGETGLDWNDPTFRSAEANIF